MPEFDLCPNCSVGIGELHSEECDIGRCKLHGTQLLNCIFAHESDACAPTIFSGYYPGAQEALERGWFSYLDQNKKWQSCDSTHPEALLDINRVIRELKWNSESEKYV